MGTHKFNSWHDYVLAANEPRSTKHEYRDSETHKADKSWDAGLGLEGALEMAVNGWDSIRPNITKLTDSITDDLKDTLMDTFRSVYDVAGSTVDIGRYMAGEPENMVTVLPVQESTVGRVVTILVNAAFNCGVDAVDIQRRGVAICALVECLALMQHETEIWSEMTVTADGLVHTELIKLKAAGDPLDIPELMFCIAHPASLRRVSFRYMETLDDMKRIGAGYGSPHNLTCGELVGANIKLDQLYGGFDDAEHWVREHLLKFGLLG
jgi:hypothetical protein